MLRERSLVMRAVGNGSRHRQASDVVGRGVAGVLDFCLGILHVAENVSWRCSCVLFSRISGGLPALC
jgi:hypothetical protein